jgi:hypothetical protein
VFEAGPLGCRELEPERHREGGRLAGIDLPTSNVLLGDFRERFRPIGKLSVTGVLERSWKEAESVRDSSGEVSQGYHTTYKRFLLSCLLIVGLDL